MNTLKVYLKSLINKKEAIKDLTPCTYAQSIYTIDYLNLKKIGIKNLFFDIDNTILPVNTIEVNEKLKTFFNYLKKEFTICLISNNKESRVKPVANALNVRALSKAHKPNKKAITQALEIVKGNPENTAMIGDQILTDILGGNKLNIYTILVNPLTNKYDFKTGISRILQNSIMKKIKKEK